MQLPWRSANETIHFLLASNFVCQSLSHVSRTAFQFGQSSQVLSCGCILTTLFTFEIVHVPFSFQHRSSNCHCFNNTSNYTVTTFPLTTNQTAVCVHESLKWTKTKKIHKPPLPPSWVVVESHVGSRGKRAVPFATSCLQTTIQMLI